VSARLPPAPFLYPIVDADAVGEARVVSLVLTLAASGVRLLQIRAKHASDRVLLGLAEDAVRAAHRHGALLIVNDRADVARLVGADGVHVGQDDLTPADVRAVVGPAAIVGFSTHNLEQLEAAGRQPVDYVALGPIFGTRSKRDPDPAVGLSILAAARARTTLPLVAIGGITRANARSVAAAGADGLAVISDLVAAADVPAAVREFEAALRAG
jgi:thiamine-phosphate pyrophosphorylase